MSIPVNVEPTLIRRIARWWRNRTDNRATLTAFWHMGAEHVEWLAHDVSLTGTDVRTLAGKWPASAALLSRRMAWLDLDEGKVGQEEPQVIRDMQRVCSLCTDKRRCEHDLADATSGRIWRGYWPNVQTLEALDAERAGQVKPQPATRMPCSDANRTN